MISGYLITLLLVSEHEQNGRISLAPVLVPPRPPAAAGAYTLLLVVVAHRRAVRAGAGRADPRRRDRRAHLRHELVPDLHRPVVLPELRPAVAAPAPLVAGRGGAVLPGVAADHRWSCSCVCRRRPERMAIPMLAMVAGVDRADGGALRPDRPVAGVLRHRHPRRRPHPRRHPGPVLAAGLPEPGRRGRQGPDPRPRRAGRARRRSAVIMATVGDQDALLYRGGFLVVGLATARLHRHGHPPASSLVAKVLAIRPVVWVGTRSYAIYLWHWPVFCLTRPGVDVPWSARGHRSSCGSPSPACWPSCRTGSSRARSATAPSASGPPSCTARRAHDRQRRLRTDPLGGRHPVGGHRRQRGRPGRRQAPRRRGRAEHQGRPERPQHPDVGGAGGHPGQRPTARRRPPPPSPTTVAGAPDPARRPPPCRPPPRRRRPPRCRPSSTRSPSATR